MVGVKRNRNLTYNEFKFDEIKNLEAICIKISRNNHNLYIYAVYIQYRRIDKSLNAFYNSHLRSIEALHKLVNTRDTVVICGDFNFGNRITWIENDIGFDYIPVLGESSERKTEIARSFATSGMEIMFFSR